MPSFRKIMRESLPTLAVVSSIQMITGLLLNSGIKLWVALPVLLMLIPQLNEYGNDVSCIVSSKVTTLLALGLLKPEASLSPEAKKLVQMIVFFALTSLSYLAFVNMLAIWLFHGYTEFQLVFPVCLLAGIPLTVVITSLSFLIAYFAWRWGLDPDNLAIPVLTTISDVLGVVCLILAARALGIA